MLAFLWHNVRRGDLLSIVPNSQFPWDVWTFSLFLFSWWLKAHGNVFVSLAFDTWERWTWNQKLVTASWLIVIVLLCSEIFGIVSLGIFEAVKHLLAMYFVCMLMVVVCHDAQAVKLKRWYGSHATIIHLGKLILRNPHVFVNLWKFSYISMYEIISPASWTQIIVHVSLQGSLIIKNLGIWREEYQMHVEIVGSFDQRNFSWNARSAMVCKCPRHAGGWLTTATNAIL